jgi:uncharacterized protein with HEPN domain
MNPPDRIRLQHMLEAAEEALSFARGRSREDLDSDRQFTLSVVKCLEIVGEAASNVSQETAQELAQVPWRAIISMRNRLIHGYFTINLAIVWQTISEDLPVLVTLLRSIAEPQSAEGEMGRTPPTP